MLNKKIIFYAWLVPYSIFGAIAVVENPRVIAYVEESLPHEGLLKQTKEGFLYVELPSEYVFGVISLMSQVGISPPPYFEGEKVGAHITVATEEEMANTPFRLGGSTSFQLDERIPFSILNFACVQLENSKLGREIYVLTVDSPKIGEIRKSLGLPPKIKGYDFHITVGVNRCFLRDP